MATIASTASDRAAGERKYYSRMAWFILAMIFLGFAPSFYARGLVHVPRPNPTLPPAVMLHGVLLTAWVLVFFTQVQLIGASRRDVHMKLGIGGFLLGAALIPVMYLTAVWQVARVNQPPFTDPLNWTIVPLAGVPIYAYLLYLGWTKRREAAWHKRIMLGIMLVMMDPAIGRFPLAPPTLAGFAFLNLLSVAPFIAPVLHDRRMLGRIHPATLLTFSLAVAMHVVRLSFLATGAWAPIAARLPGVGA
jgi:hypothetical protein